MNSAYLWVPYMVVAHQEHGRPPLGCPGQPKSKTYDERCKGHERQKIHWNWHVLVTTTTTTSSSIISISFSIIIVTSRHGLKRRKTMEKPQQKTCHWYASSHHLCCAPSHPPWWLQLPMPLLGSLAVEPPELPKNWMVHRYTQKCHGNHGKMIFYMLLPCFTSSN